MTADNTFTGINVIDRNVDSVALKIKAHDLIYTPGQSVSNNYSMPIINYVENGNENILAQMYFKLKTDKTTELKVGTLTTSGGLDEDTIATEKKNNTFSGINNFNNNSVTLVNTSLIYDATGAHSTSGTTYAIVFSANGVEIGQIRARINANNTTQVEVRAKNSDGSWTSNIPLVTGAVVQ